LSILHKQQTVQHCNNTDSKRKAYTSFISNVNFRKEGRKELKYTISSLGLKMMDKFRRIILSWLVEKTLTGKKNIMNALCKHYTAFSSLVHQEGHNKKRQDCTDMDLLGKSRRAN